MLLVFKHINRCVDIIKRCVNPPPRGVLRLNAKRLTNRMLHQKQDGRHRKHTTLGIG